MALQTTRHGSDSAREFRRRAGRTSAITCFPAILLLVGHASVQAQPTWEYSPYEVHVWIAMSDSATLPPVYYDRMAHRIADRSWTVFGSVWAVQTRPCPSHLRYDVLHRLEAITEEEIQSVSEDLLDRDDKLYLVSIQDDSTAFHIRVRELDCRTRIWQPLVSREVVQPDRLIDAVFDCLPDAFTPLMRVENARSKDAEVRVRAGGLITRPQCPATVSEGDNLLPVIRRNDRLGKPMKNGIVVAPWTIMSVSGQAGNLLQCRIHSGMRSALGGRASTRTVKLALKIKPRYEATQLVLETRGEDPQPLAGYAIYAKDPTTEESDLIGTTDWRGTIRILRTDPELMIYYVRNGGRLLARLPMAAGLESQSVAQLYNDDVRLQAEGFVKGMQHQIMDLVARRELYKLRFRRHLKQKEFDQAQALLEEFGSLQSGSHLNNLITGQERGLTSGDRRVQAKIDELISDTRQLVSKFVKPGMLTKLQEELLKARSTG